MSLAVGGAFAGAKTGGNSGSKEYGGGDHQYGTRPGKGCGDRNHIHTGPPGNPSNTDCPNQSRPGGPPQQGGKRPGQGNKPAKPAKTKSSRKCAKRTRGKSKRKANASKRRAGKRVACVQAKKKSSKRK